MSAEKFSVQNTVWDLEQHAVKLTKKRVFAGHQAARTLFMHYCHNTAANTTGNMTRLYVMPGSIAPKIVAAHTGLGEWAIGKAMSWLHEQGLVEVEEHTGGRYRYVSSVRVLSTNDVTEAERQVTAGKHLRTEVAARKKRPGKKPTTEDQA